MCYNNQHEDTKHNDSQHKWHLAYQHLTSVACKPITIVSDDSSIVNKLETSLIDDARVIIYDRHMFIVQATGVMFFIVMLGIAMLSAVMLSVMVPFWTFVCLQLRYLS